jgi:hypothetical protein
MNIGVCVAPDRQPNSIQARVAKQEGGWLAALLFSQRGGSEIPGRHDGTCNLRSANWPRPPPLGVRRADLLVRVNDLDLSESILRSTCETKGRTHDLPNQKVIYKVEDPISHLYFVERGLISLIKT